MEGNLLGRMLDPLGSKWTQKEGAKRQRKKTENHCKLLNRKPLPAISIDLEKSWQERRGTLRLCLRSMGRERRSWNLQPKEILHLIS
jgi:hypothetical protein